MIIIIIIIIIIMMMIIIIIIIIMIITIIIIGAIPEHNYDAIRYIEDFSENIQYFCL